MKSNCCDIGWARSRDPGSWSGIVNAESSRTGGGTGGGTAEKNGRRYLAVWFPFLPTDRLRREEGRCDASAEAAVVLVEKVKGALRLAAVDPQAVELGLSPGMTLADVDRASVDAVIFVSQTPDYRLPATACLLQDRLGLRPGVIGIDVSLEFSSICVVDGTGRIIREAKVRSEPEALGPPWSVYA